MSGGKQRLCLRFVLPWFALQKRAPHLALWLFWFCVCGYWCLCISPSHGHHLPALANVLTALCVYTIRVKGIGNCSWCSAFHHSTTKLDEKEVFLEVEHPLGLDPCNCSVTLCIKISWVFPKYLRQAPLDGHRLRTDASLRDSLRPFSDNLALWKQKSALWQEWGVEPKRFSLIWGFFARERKRKTRKEVPGAILWILPFLWFLSPFKYVELLQSNKHQGADSFSKHDPQTSWKAVEKM